MSATDTSSGLEATRYSGFRSLTIEFSEDDVKAAMLAKVDELRPTFRVPGFRPGKVPTQFILDRLGAGLRKEVFNDLCVERANEAIPQQDKDALLAQPTIRRAEDSPEDSGTHRMLVEYNLAPEVSPVDFESMEFERVDVNLDDEAVREVILKDLEESPLAGDPVEGRAAEVGDFVDLDYALHVQGREFHSSEQGQPRRVRASDEAPEDSAPRRVVGLLPGGAFSVNHRFPEETEDARLRGARGEYRYKVRAVRPPLPPALDDLLVETSGLDSLEALINVRRDSLKGVAKLEERRFLHAQLFRRLSEVEADTDPAREREIALQLRRGDQLAEDTDHETAGNRSEDAVEDGAAEAHDEHLAPEDLARARRILRYHVMLAVLTRRLGIAIDKEDLPRALIGWTSDPAHPEYRLHFQHAVVALSRDPTLVRQAQYDAASEKLLDAILPRVRTTERKMKLPELGSHVLEFGREWLIARMIS